MVPAGSCSSKEPARPISGTQVWVPLGFQCRHQKHQRVRGELTAWCGIRCSFRLFCFDVVNPQFRRFSDLAYESLPSSDCYRENSVKGCCNGFLHAAVTPSRWLSRSDVPLRRHSPESQLPFVLDLSRATFIPAEVPHIRFFPQRPFAALLCRGSALEESA